MSPFPLLFLVAVFVLGIAAVLPARSPRMEIRWHQNCLYATNPETLEGYGEPVNPCDRKYWDI